MLSEAMGLPRALIDARLWAAMGEAVVAGASTHRMTSELFDPVFPGLEGRQIDLVTINGAEAHGEYSGLGYSQEVLGLGAGAGHDSQSASARKIAAFSLNTSSRS